MNQVGYSCDQLLLKCVHSMLLVSFLLLLIRSSAECAIESCSEISDSDEVLIVKWKSVVAADTPSSIEQLVNSSWMSSYVNQAQCRNLPVKERMQYDIPTTKGSTNPLRYEVMRVEPRGLGYVGPNTRFEIKQ